MTIARLAQPRAGRETMPRPAWHGAALVVVPIAGFLLLLALFWVGYIGADDGLYWTAAGEWLRHAPYVGTSHWALRHPLVLPLAVSRWAFGDGMLAMALPTVLYGLGMIAVLAVWSYRAAGAASAAAAMAIVITNPQFVLEASSANIDIPEMFFVFLGFALLHGAMERPERRRWTLLLLSGLSLGLGMLCRETTVFAVVAIGLLFLVGYGLRRIEYFAVGTGYAAVVGTELLLLAGMTGTLLYRSNISVHHDGTINRWADQGAGVPLIHPAIDPFTMMLLNHNFGAVYWICAPLAVWAVLRGRFAGQARRLVVLALTLAVVWALIAAELWVLLPLTPRYSLLPAILVSLVAGLALVQLWHRGFRRMSALLGAALLAGNLAALSIDNRNFMYGEAVLVGIASRSPEPIRTDPQTRRRAALLLGWSGVESRVSGEAPMPGGLYFVNPARAAAPAAAVGWTVVERHGLPPTIGQRLAGVLLPAGVLSPGLMNKLGRGHPDVALYRVPSGG